MGLKNSILFTLADGRAHNPAEICDQLAISVADLHAVIGGLVEDGITIKESPAGDLNWEDRFIPFNETAIRQGLSAETNHLLRKFEIHYSLSSTNDFLLSAANLSPCVCLAEKQTRGKGRQGRTWISPVGENIYCSLGWTFNSWPDGIQRLSLLSALVVARVLKDLGYSGVAVKWPNDIYLDEKKLGGLLLETRGIGDGLGVIIGIGLNVAMQHPSQQIEQPWTSLFATNALAPLHRNEYVAALLQALTGMLEDIVLANDELEQQWPQYDLTSGRQVKVVTNTDCVIGEGCGIDTEGRFQLATANGLQCFSSADVSLRLQ